MFCFASGASCNMHACVLSPVRLLLLPCAPMHACTCMYTCADLSGGQRKRVSIGIEIVSKPPVMFMVSTCGVGAGPPAVRVRRHTGTTNIYTHGHRQRACAMSTFVWVHMA